MSEGDASHAAQGRRGRLLRRTTTGLVLALLVAAGASYRFDLGERFGIAVTDPDTDPARVEPPAGLDLPPAAAAPSVARADRPGQADPAAVARALMGLVTAPKLGRRVSVAVAGLGSSDPVFEAGTPVVTPASTLKLLTTAAALEVLGPDHRFATTVVRAGREIVLVGGGDPLLTRQPDEADRYPRRADLTTLARLTAAALTGSGVARVRLGYDTSLFTGPTSEDTWEDDYISGNVVSPITSLWVDGGRERPGYSQRSADPALAAAQYFAGALAKRGIRIAGAPEQALAPSTGAQIAVVEGPPLSQVVQHVLELSDNEAAEVLVRQVAVATGDQASFDGGTASVARVLRRLGVRLPGAVIADGSGLSRADRLHYDSLLDVLRLGATNPRVRTVVSGLPVAGFSGSLALRFDTAAPAALGEVRAKTGTLTGVHGLAGIVRTRDGVLLAFVAIADRVKVSNTLAARARLDEIAGALAACACA